MNFRGAQTKRGLAVIELTPLVDVVFLLLIFFLLTATYVQNPNIDINLPKSSLSQVTNEQKDIAIAITKDGDIRYENQDVSIKKLEGILAAEYSENKNSVIVIQADTDSKHGTVVEVMDLAKTIGFEKLAIAIQAAYGDEQ